MLPEVVVRHSGCHRDFLGTTIIGGACQVTGAKPSRVPAEPIACLVRQNEVQFVIDIVAVKRKIRPAEWHAMDRASKVPQAETSSGAAGSHFGPPSMTNEPPRKLVDIHDGDLDVHVAFLSNDAADDRPANWHDAARLGSAADASRVVQPGCACPPADLPTPTAAGIHAPRTGLPLPISNI
jgi:hypothetical protein